MGSKGYWRSKNVFVTGATGILGSWLTSSLVERGANVVCLIRDSVPISNFYLLELEKKVTIVHGDLVNYEVIERALNEYEIDTCYHLGAQTIVRTGNRSPLSTFESNIKGTWNVLEAARNSKLLERLVVASSDKAYGSQEKLPYDESDQLKGVHPYDVSKSCADMLAQAFFATYDLPLCVSRCGNIYGGGDLNFNRIVPGTVRSVLFNEDPIIRSDGSYIRDYFYVLDAVDAYLTLGEKLNSHEVKGQAFNFGTETPISVLDIVNEIIEISGRRHLKPVILNEVTGEIRAQYLSYKKARKVLGWKPKFSLEAGLKQTVNWYEKFFEILFKT